MEQQYFPCPICCGPLYVIEVGGVEILCCESCACIQENMELLTDSQPDSPRSIAIRAMGKVSVESRAKMNELLAVKA